MYIKIKADKLKDILEKRSCIALLNKEGTYLGCVDYEEVVVDDTCIKFREYDVCGLTLSLDSIHHFDEEGTAIVFK